MLTIQGYNEFNFDINERMLVDDENSRINSDELKNQMTGKKILKKLI